MEFLRIEATAIYLVPRPDYWDSTVMRDEMRKEAKRVWGDSFIGKSNDSILTYSNIKVIENPTFLKHG